MALLAAYSEEAATWLDAAVAYVSSNVRFLRQFVRAHVPGVHALPLDATYCVWLDCSALGLDAAGLDELMLRAGLVLSPGREFDSSGGSDHFQRINVACSRRMLENALCKLQRAVATRHQALAQLADG